MNQGTSRKGGEDGGKAGRERGKEKEGKKSIKEEGMEGDREREKGTWPQNCRESSDLSPPGQVSGP